MSEFNVSNRYANAFISAAEEKNILDKISADFSLIYNTLSASKELKAVLKSPILNEQKKMDILMDIFKSSCDQMTLKFLRFIVDKNREDLLFDISRRFLDIMNEKLGKIELQIVSALELGEDQKSKLKTKLEEITNKTVLPEFKIDEKIIGGFKVKVKDTVFDASVEQQIASLRAKLLSEAV